MTNNTNALNGFNNATTTTSQEEKETKKNNVFLNLKVTTKSGDVRNFSFLLRTSGSGFEQSNANNVIANAVDMSTTSLEKANKYLTDIFANPEKWKTQRIEGSCYLSGIKSASKDWVNDF